MSYESTAEPIKVGYLMDFTLPPGFPEELFASFTQTLRPGLRRGGRSRA